MFVPSFHAEAEKFTLVLFLVLLHYISHCIRPKSFTRSLKYGKLKSTNGPFLMHVNYKMVNCECKTISCKVNRIDFCGLHFHWFKMDNFRCHPFNSVEWLRNMQMQIEWKRPRKWNIQIIHMFKCAWPSWKSDHTIDWTKCNCNLQIVQLQCEIYVILTTE